MATRRAFLAGLGAAATVSLPGVSWAAVGNPALLAAGKLGDGYVLHGLDVGGQSLFQLPLPARGHAACAHPARPEAVAFARRPGTFALVIDCTGDADVAYRAGALRCAPHLYNDAADIDRALEALHGLG